MSGSHGYSTKVLPEFFLDFDKGQVAVFLSTYLRTCRLAGLFTLLQLVFGRFVVDCNFEGAKPLLD